MDPILAPAIAFHDIAGRPIAVRHRPAPAEAPTILFLPGYASDMDGAKAVAIDAYAAAHGVGCLRLDYSGTGSSPGDFGAGTLEGWLDEVVGLVDHLPPHRRLVVAGSSMGGWLALHLALRRPERVAGVLGIAAAPDFTEWGFGAADKALLASQDRLERPNRYGPEPSVIHRGFWQSGQAMRLLGGPIALSCPVRLMIGDCDPEVPVAVALRLVEQLCSSDVQLRLIKGSGHRLSDPSEIAAILGELDALVENAR